MVEVKGERMASGLAVGEVAARSGLSVSTLHFYERKGLIRSARSGGNQRRYGRDVLRRVAVIQAAQRLGIPLAVVGSALAALPSGRTPSREDWQTMAEIWAADLDQRIAALVRLREGLTGCIGCGCLSLDRCAIYNADDHLADAGAGPMLLNSKTVGRRRRGGLKVGDRAGP
jgi:MerR family transcriptional regulator, redox-sensitive transcriptional activator SoxR